MGRVGITSKGTTDEIGLGICFDLNYKDLVIRFGKWYLAIGVKK